MSGRRHERLRDQADPGRSDGGGADTDEPREGTADVTKSKSPAAGIAEAAEVLDLRAQVAASRRRPSRRAAELAIVNGVQTGLAARSEMQAIYDLVGDTIRETFNAQGRGHRHDRA